MNRKEFIKILEEKEKEMNNFNIRISNDISIKDMTYYIENRHFKDKN